MDLFLLWLVAGTLLVVSEFVIPGFVICFFGVSAIIVSGVCWLFPGVSFVLQLLIFAVLGVVLLFACRRLLPDVFCGRTACGRDDIDTDALEGESCVCTAEITPDVPGKVEFRGSTWSAVSDAYIPSGSHCTVVSRKNLTLKVSKQ